MCLSHNLRPRACLPAVSRQFHTSIFRNRGHCATSRKVAGSVPGGVIGIFHWHNSSGSIMALGSTQPLTEMSTSNTSWGWGVKAAGAYGWQPYHLHVPIVLMSGSLKCQEPSGPIQACNEIALSLCSVTSSFMFCDNCRNTVLIRDEVTSSKCSLTAIALPSYSLE